MIVSCLLLAAALSPGQPPKSFECRWADGPIVLDGKADEAAWKNAQVIDHFYLPWLKTPRPAKTATKARLLWDKENLYFHAEMEDADIYADVKEKDGMLWNNDVFELFFKPAEDKPGYYEFQVNPTGTLLDMFLPRRNAGGFQRFVKDGDFLWQAKVKLDGTLNNWRDKDTGWSVEGKIPWSDFLRTGGRPERGETWKFALCRYDYSVQFEGPELTSCAPLGVGKGGANFHQWEDYASLKFIGAEANKTGQPFTKRTPLTTSTVIGSPEPPPPFKAERVFEHQKLHFPVAIEPIPGTDQLLVFTLDQSPNNTRIHLVKDDPATSEAKEIFFLGETAYAMAFHPKWRENGYIFIPSSGPHKLPKDAPKEDKKTRVTRYTMQTKPPFEIDPKSALEILAWKSDGHNGAAVAFGLDGMLYITSGDGTSDSDTWETGQDMTSLLAKVLRIDVDHPEPGKTYAVPKDNPFVNLKDARPETWAFGLRNPWRMCTDPKTGHLWVAQNGQDLYEQAYLVKKGDNFGWSVTEGSAPFYLNRKKGPGPIVLPTVEHHHTEARSLTGGVVYYGTKYPELHGAYLYGDYATGNIWGVKHDGAKILWHKLLAETRLTLTIIAVDTRGEILLGDYQKAGGLYTLVPTPKETKPSVFPRKLSDSGLFESVKGHVMKPSLVPYSVNSVLWSDGAAKERWLGLPGDATIPYAARRSWALPDETVIVKSFWIEDEPGNTKTKRWIETRFLTRQRGEWFGYSYAWNEEQTEGHLVEAGGRDRDFVQRERGRKKTLNWHYPSRTECMYCHSRAANWVLGLSEAQFNKVHDYGHGFRANQFDVFETLGLFKFSTYQADARKAVKEKLKEAGKLDKDINPYLAHIAQAPDQRTHTETSFLSTPPENLAKMVDPGDKTQDLTLRVRSYLHSNCSQCHVEAGGGNSAMELGFFTPLEKTRLIDVVPLHDKFGIEDARLVAPGHPERSVLLHRISHRNKGFMPPLATRVVDAAAVEMLREWIQNLDPK